ncbi:MAG: DUF3795 domain-containing protein [Methanoregula sp.]|nr:DUF3795 domain-containing protein [Methanoregula sp.]
MTRQTATTSAVTASQKPEIRARCGFLCSSCPSFKENATTDAARKRVSDGWQKLYGLVIPPEVIYCDGCLEPDENNPRRIARECPMRTCVLEKKIAHCGECSTFPCGLIEKHLASVEIILPKARETLSPEEYKDFVGPYLCRAFLDSTKR